ncbi:glycosyltransferase family 2 protein [Treponema sp. HNW]|uniref:glycosyltransferase family 2 protein n=1 Tax=Treponema sp. HNW TaxID=3116654 RepID=UPI003D0D5022
MNKTPFFSVITASYNQADSISVTLESVYAQKDISVEHIIIDNESTDDTIAVVKTFQKNHSDACIRFISEKDRGIYDAFNKGLALAKGSFIAFLGCGDTYTENALKNVKNAYDTNGGDVFYGIVDMTDGNSHSWYSYSPDYLLKEGKMMHHSAAFVRKSVYEEAGGFDTKYKSASDLNTFIKIALLNKKFIFIPEILTVFKTGGSSTATSRSFYERCEIMHNHKILPEKEYKQILFKRTVKKILSMLCLK